MNLEISALDTPIPLEEFHNIGVYHVCDVTDEILQQKQITNWDEIIGVPQAVSAFDLLKNEQSINFGIESLDQLLENHFSGGTIVELVGAPGSGKSQVCFYAAVNSQILGGIIVYINTNKSFASHRIKEISMIRGHKSDEILRNIHCIECRNMNELEASLLFLQYWEKISEVKLLIIDSISFIFKQEIDILQRTVSLTSFLQKLRALGSSNNFPVIITNDLTTSMEDEEVLHIPCFGEGFYHCIDTRVILSKKHQKFYARLEKSALKPAQEVCFNV